LNAVQIKSSSGDRHLVFSDARWTRDELSSFTASVEVEAMSATTQVYAYGGRSPTELFEDMASEWRGWEGSKEWSSLEDELALSATHNGLGTITLQVRLSHLGSEGWDWEARAALELDAGDQLERAVTSLRSFFSS
jgi:hypothetical protein